MSDVTPGIMVSHFEAQDAVDAFGLAKLAFPDLTPSRWRQLVRRWTTEGRPKAGALLARDAAGRIAGFAPFEARTDLCPGQTLWVERVVAVSLVDTGPAIRALAHALLDVAHDLGCRRLKIETCLDDRALRRALGKTGTARSALVEAMV